MGKRVITPSEVDLYILDIRVSCKGFRRLGTPVDNNILIGSVEKDVDEIILPELHTNGERYLIARGVDVVVMVRNISVVEGLVYANVIAMNVYTAFELESVIFSLLFNCRVKDKQIIVKDASVTKRNYFND
ncbi:MAG: hypothetical protein ACRC0G_07405 [Fusobacteriaceae bacterium]